MELPALLPGWPLEIGSDACPRWMTAAGCARVQLVQNSAYRLTPQLFHFTEPYRSWGPAFKKQHYTGYYYIISGVKFKEYFKWGSNKSSSPNYIPKYPKKRQYFITRLKDHFPNRDPGCKNIGNF